MIQTAQSAFLALLLAHLLGDFLLQPAWIAQNKGKRFWPLFWHGIAHYLLAWVCLFLFAPAPFSSIYSQFVVLIYAAIHLLIDKLKSSSISRHRSFDNWQVFLIDQLLHIIVLAFAACALVRSCPVTLFYGLKPSPAAKFHILETAIVYVAVVIGGGYLIRYLTQGFAVKSVSRGPRSLHNAGLYVGWIERFLVITAISVRSPALVGLILTGKSIARFPEFKETRFAEYFLIGTLLSFSLALMGGILLQYLIYGAVSFN